MRLDKLPMKMAGYQPAISVQRSPGKIVFPSVYALFLKDVPDLIF